MSLAEYAQSDLGVSDLMVSGYGDLTLLVQLGKYYIPNSSGIGESGLMVSGCESQGAALALVEPEGFRIEDAGLTAIPEATFQVVRDPDDAPQDGDPVIIAVGTLQDRLFGGYLTNPKAVEIASDYVRYQCTARGWARDLEKRLISGRWQNEYAGDILRDILSTYTPQFICGGYVQDGIQLADYQADEESLLSLCNALADQCGYVFYLDPVRDVHFHQAVTLAAPWDIEDAARFGNLQISPDSKDLVNRVIVRYSELRSQAESFVGDGAAKEFTLAYPPFEVSSLTVNGVAVTYGSSYSEDNSTNDFGIDYTRGIIKTMAHATLTVAQTLAIAYTAKFPARLERSHRASIDDRIDKEGGDGLYDLLITDRNLVAIADARARADAELGLYAWPRVSASYVRVEPVGDIFANRLQVGQQQRLNYLGFNELLNIEKVTLEVLRPSPTDLIFLQNVALGPQPKTLKEVLQKTTANTQQDAAAGTELLYEEDYV
jgi:hypothetical protein